jgi:glyoxylase-like metal-dependent hydrolase (beta-lactamase superfamily II)
MRNAFLLAALPAALLCPAALNADSHAPVVDGGARMERIADGVYAIIHDDATEEWPHGNTGVVIGEDAVLVVDSTYLPSRARADIALIRSVTPKPVRYLVYTHWHFDHNNGGHAYRESYPGVKIVSERATRDFIDLNSTWWGRRSSRPDQPKRTALAQLEKQLADGVDAEGKALSGAARTALERNVAQRQAELDELASLVVAPPDLLFDQRLDLRLGKRRVELKDWGRANSPHDVTIYVPDAQVLFAGDILVQSPVPYFFESWPLPWIEVLRGLEAVPVAAVVPGHGPVMHDHTYTRQVRALLEATTARVAAMAREGKSLEEIQRDLDLSDVRRAVPAWAAPERDEDWRVTTRALIERAWRGVRGQGG